MSGSSSLTMLPVLLLLSTDLVQARVLPLVSTSSLPSVSPSSSPLTCSAAATGLRPDLLWFRDGERLSGGERSHLGGEMTEVMSTLSPGCSSVARVYTCVAVAGAEEITSQTLVLPNLEEEECQEQERITTWDSNVLARIGSHVELRCEDLVDGVVVPGVWAGQGDTGGGLRLTDLRWEDMGVYTCITQQGERDTFLYPYTP